MSSRPKGFCSLVGATDGAGNAIKLSDVVRYGWATPVSKPTGFDIGDDEIPLGHNLFLDNARQYMAFAMAFRSPISDYVIQKFGAGTGTLPVNVSDVELQNRVEITPGSGTYTKLIDGADFPAPFTTAFNFTLAAGELNGYLLTEFGLYSGNDTLMMRWVLPSGISKSADYVPTLRHRLTY